ncbi:MAG: DEAD/DEAH box helicase [Candidatus Uhrbacteria bacterium]|nr:DEAD/DEAH box helicase [Candidatus Uhrbacteria bacterium]
MPREELEHQDFNGLGIKPGLLKRVQALGFAHPTPIQYKAIPIATSGEDVVGIAQTGSGKTLAFSIPMLQHVSATQQMGLILLPTRELAVQVDETLRKVAGKSGLRTAILIGGTNPGSQIRQLKARPHIIVATPGRLIDLVEQKYISLSEVGMLVLDEADRMLDMGFAPQLKRILAFIPQDRQTMLFSATMPKEIAAIASQYMRKPLRIEVTKPGTTVENVDQEVFIVPRDQKIGLLQELLKEYKGSVLVFSRTKHGAAKITRDIRRMGFAVDEIHSNRSQNQRQNALKGFSTGKYRILVATDIASRGIDVDNIQLVVNYDLPDQIEDYVHRIGRTARAGKSGKAISFAAPEQKKDIKQIEKLINLTLPIKSLAGKKFEPINRAKFDEDQRRQSTSSRPGGRSYYKKSSQGRSSGGGGYSGGRSGGSSSGRAGGARSGGGSSSAGHRGPARSGGAGRGRRSTQRRSKR